MSQWARENGWTKRTTYTLRAVGVHRRVPILGHGNNLRDCLRVGIAGWVELRADVEGSDAIEGGRVILSAGRQSGKARDGSDSSSKQNTPQHFRRPTIDRYQENADGERPTAVDSGLRNAAVRRGGYPAYDGGEREEQRRNLFPVRHSS